MCWGDRSRARECEARYKELLDAVVNVRYSILSRIHDDAHKRELYDIELDILDKVLGYERK